MSSTSQSFQMSRKKVEASLKAYGLQNRQRTLLNSFRRHRHSQFFHHHLQVLPGFFLLPRIAQQKRGMISDGELGAAEIEPASPKLGHGCVNRQKRFCRHRAQSHDCFGFDGRDLPHQKWRASLALIPLRRTVSRWATLDDVRNINIFPPQAHGLNHVVEQLSGAPDEGLTLLVFIRARSLADEHQISFWIADSEDDLLASLLAQAA